MQKILLSLVFILAVTVNSNAQSTATKNQSITLSLQNAVELTLISNTGGNYFLFDNVDKYENGLTNLNASTLKVRSNRPWSISVKANTANFTGGNLTTPMPANILAVGINNASFLPLSLTGQDIKSGSRGNHSTVGNIFNIDYKATPGFDYSAGTYVLSVVYTITQL